MANLQTIFQTLAWRLALEKYGAATGTTLAVYGTPERLLLGGVHSTPLFEVVSRGHSDPPMFSACAGRSRSPAETPFVIEENGIAVIGSHLIRQNEVIGTVVAGYACTAFPEESSVRRFALRHDLPFLSVWHAIRRQAPVTRARLDIYAELLKTLCDTLLSENLRAQDYERSAARLAATNEAKDQFLAMLAHELRNPLGPIRVAMHIIGIRHAQALEVQKAHEVVDRQVKNLTRLLDDLMDVSRITRGKVELRKESVNLSTAVANALETSRDLIEQHGHSLSVSLSEEPVVVDADPIRLEQVITNLLNNAARYTPTSGHISISAGREQADAVLTVQDDGVGISPELLPHVFDLFTQADRSLARSEGGLGIGLTIVHNLVELHGGTVTVESEGLGRELAS